MTADLPVPADDGAADHLPGAAVPALDLPATTGDPVRLTAIGGPRAILYLYPKTARPGVAMPDDWELIPGAKGCTPEACSFRDHHTDLAELGATVYGLSSQSTDYQREAAERLHLPFALLSDPGFALADALRLPTFEADGERLYSRLTLVLRDGVVEHAFYPVFPPGEHAERVLDWLRENR